MLGENPKGLPQVLFPPGHFQLIEKIYKRARHTFQAAAKPSTVQRRTFVNAKNKFNAASAIVNVRDSASSRSRRVLEREEFTPAISIQQPWHISAWYGYYI